MTKKAKSMELTDRDGVSGEAANLSWNNQEPWREEALSRDEVLALIKAKAERIINHLFWSFANDSKKAFDISMDANRINQLTQMLDALNEDAYEEAAAAPKKKKKRK